MNICNYFSCFVSHTHTHTHTHKHKHKHKHTHDIDMMLSNEYCVVDQAQNVATCIKEYPFTHTPMHIPRKKRRNEKLGDTAREREMRRERL